MVNAQPSTTETACQMMTDTYVDKFK